jgi:HSP20 family molecular chaperone IbpA
VNRLFETIHRTEFPEEGFETASGLHAADVYETPDEIILQIELPALRLEDVKLESLDETSRLRTPARAIRVAPRDFVRMERIYGSFSREFAVPPQWIHRRSGAALGQSASGSWLKSNRSQAIPVEPRRLR